MKIVLWVRVPDTILDNNQQPHFAGKKLLRIVFILIKKKKSCVAVGSCKNEKNNNMLILQLISLDEDTGADRMHKILGHKWIIINYFASAM